MSRVALEVLDKPADVGEAFDLAWRAVDDQNQNGDHQVRIVDK